jgi:ligand-binding sensor domain-containing protein
VATDRRADGPLAGRARLVLGMLLLSVGPSVRPSVAQSLFRPDERVHLTDFSVVTAIAASPYWVYAATTGGLTMYDRRFQRWALPVTPLDGYPARPRRVLVALADPGEESVWLGLSDGWARYSPEIRRWEGGLTGGPVRNLMFDADDPVSGIYLDVAGQWAFLPRGGMIPVSGRPLPQPARRIVPLDAQTAFRLAPAAEALRPILLTDARLRSHRFTSAARSTDREEIFFGTDGMGVVRVDLLTSQAERLPTGLLAPAVGAVASGPDGVWAASIVTRVAFSHGPVERRGLTFVGKDLSESRTVEGPAVQGLGFVLARQVLVWHGTVWVATEIGLVRVDPAGAELSASTLMAGLPSPVVHALAPAPDGVWVGTRSGLAHVSDVGVVTRVARDFTDGILSLLVVGDTLWVGSASGLGTLLPGETSLLAARALDRAPALRTRILSLTRVGRTIVAATTEHVGWRDPDTGEWRAERPTAPVGRIAMVRGDPDGGAETSGGVWLGGTGGLTFWRLGGAATRVLRYPGDLPGNVRDLALDQRFLWVATDEGLVRFDRGAALGVVR